MKKIKLIRPISGVMKSTVTYYPYAGNKDFKFTLIISNKSTITSTQQHHVERKILDVEQVQKFKNLLGVLDGNQSVQSTRTTLIIQQSTMTSTSKQPTILMNGHTARQSLRKMQKILLSHYSKPMMQSSQER